MIHIPNTSVVPGSILLKKWKINVAKKYKNKGEEYIGLSTKTKTFVKAKEVGPLCRYGCFEKGRCKLDEIFNEFWKIEDYALETVISIH